MRGKVQLWGGPLDGKWVSTDLEERTFVWKGHVYRPTNEADALIALYRYVNHDRRVG